MIAFFTTFFTVAFGFDFVTFVGDFFTVAFDVTGFFLVADFFVPFAIFLVTAFFVADFFTIDFTFREEVFATAFFRG